MKNRKRRDAGRAATTVAAVVAVRWKRKRFGNVPDSEPVKHARPCGRGSVSSFPRRRKTIGPCVSK